MKPEVTAVFDIGKTNKKFFLFDEKLKAVHQEQIRLEEITDEDGFPAEDLAALETWMKQVLMSHLNSADYTLKALNFSSYGASLVHLDPDGNVAAPLYNYLKPLDDQILDSFYQKYGPEIEFAKATGAKASGMLNSGLQLYWLKYKRPDVFKKINKSLHFPQYLSYFVSGRIVSEKTSIGCHTALWDFLKRDYHSWVYQEEIHRLFPPIVSSQHYHVPEFSKKPFKTGVGLHDSSASLLPYLLASKKRFILLSTGTWNVSLNPFSFDLLNDSEIQSGCILYMKMNGEAVKSSRIMLGKEHEFQVGELYRQFNLSENHPKNPSYNPDVFKKVLKDYQACFTWKYLEQSDHQTGNLTNVPDFEEAYHQLITELVILQVKNIEIVRDKQDPIDVLYVDGGFNNNDVFMNILQYFLAGVSIFSSNLPTGSALGAAIAVNQLSNYDQLLQNKFNRLP